MRLVDADPNSATCKFSIASKPPNPLWEFTRTPAVDVTVCSMLPCTTYIFFELAGGISFFTYVTAAPVSATKTVARFCLLRNFAPWGGAIADHIARNAVYQVPFCQFRRAVPRGGHARPGSPRSGDISTEVGVDSALRNECVKGGSQRQNTSMGVDKRCCLFVSGAYQPP